MEKKWKKILSHDRYYHAAKAILGFMIGCMWILVVVCLVAGVIVGLAWQQYMYVGIALVVFAIILAVLTIMETVMYNLMLYACYDIKMIRDKTLNVPDSKFCPHIDYMDY